MLQRRLGDDHAGHHRAVAAHGDVGEGDEFVRVPQIFDEGDGADVEFPGDQAFAQLLGGVLGEFQIQQGAGPRQAPVQGETVQKLNVPTRGRVRGCVLTPVRVRLVSCEPTASCDSPRRGTSILPVVHTACYARSKLQFGFPCSTSLRSM